MPASGFAGHCPAKIFKSSAPRVSSLPASSPIWAGEARGASREPRASRASTFHDIPQMEILLAGYVWETSRSGIFRVFPSSKMWNVLCKDRGIKKDTYCVFELLRYYDKNKWEYSPNSWHLTHILAISVSSSTDLNILLVSVDYIPYSCIPAASVHIMISIKMHEYGKANNNIG